MSDNIIEFKGKEEQPEEHHSCETCDLAFEFMQYALEAESPEEMFEIMGDLVHEAKKIGQKELLIAQVNQNFELLDQLEGFAYDCEDCCETEE